MEAKGNSHNSPFRNPSVTWVISIALALFAAPLLWKLRNIQQIADSLGIVYDVRLGHDLFNPHHLLFGLSVRLVYVLLHSVGINVDAVGAAQVFNISWSVIGIISFFLITLQITRRSAFSALAALSLLFAHTYWQFSTQSEVYISATGLILVMLAWLICFPAKRLTVGTLLLMTVLLSLSICYHQTGVLLLVPLWIFYYLQHGHKGLRFMALFTITSGLVTLFAYVAVYLSPGNAFSINGFIHYCLQYAYLNPDWGTTAHFRHSAEWIKIFTNQASSFVPAWRLASYPLSFIIIKFVFLWGWNLVMAIRKKPWYAFRFFILAWLGTFYLFLVWWTAGYEFFILTIPPTLFLGLFVFYDILQWIDGYRKMKNIVTDEAVYSIPAIFLLAMLLILNLSTFFKYHRQHDAGYIQAQRSIELCGTCKVVTNFNIMTNLSYYHNYLNTVESDGWNIAYFYKDTVAQKYRLRQDSCVLMELWYLSPWYTSIGKNGFELPEKYSKVINDVFDIKTDADHIVCRDFKVIPGNGTTGDYILIGPAHREAKNYDQLFTALDDSILSKGIKNQAEFGKWYQQKGKNIIGL